MKVLIACEESQAVCKEFRKLGHDAWSCDIQECSGGRPEWHIKGDAIKEAYSGKYDLMVAHPPCTYLSNSGVCWLYKKKERWKDMIEGAVFFRKLLLAPIDKIAIENPVPHKYGVSIIGQQYNQTIQPWMFGHPESKATCFWLKKLPLLKETENVKHIYDNLPANIAQRLHYLPPSADRAKLRSKTYSGIARAIAEQWGVL
jgi:hypothetical protein